MSTKRINNLCLILVIFVSQAVFGQSPQLLNITIILKEKLVVDSGCIKSNAIRINNLQIGDTIKSTPGDSIILKLEFINHEYVLNIEHNAEKYFYEISKQKFLIKQIGIASLINHLRFLYICNPYSLFEIKTYDSYSSNHWVGILSKKCGSKILITGEYKIKDLLKNRNQKQL